MDETVDWLSDYFLRSRLSKPDLRSFGLYSAWTPYISEVACFWDHLTGCLIDMHHSSCAKESVGSGKIMKGKPQMSSRVEDCDTWSLISEYALLFVTFMKVTFVLHSHSSAGPTQQDCKVISALGFSSGD